MQTFKIRVYLYATDAKINPFAVGNMINPLLHVNKVFSEQLENFLRATFQSNTMEIIRDVMINKDNVLMH